MTIRNAPAKSPREQLADAIAASRPKRGARRAQWKRDSQGRNHPSKGEADWFDQQYEREKRGHIQILEVEPSWQISLQSHGDQSSHYLCTVKADMKVRELMPGADGRATHWAVRFIDYKGHTGDTEVSALKRKMVLIQHGVTIELVGRYVEQKARRAARKKQAADLKRMARKSARKSKT